MNYTLTSDSLYIRFVDDVDQDAAMQNPSLGVKLVHDKMLVYTAFFADFGPLNLGLTVKFCHQLTSAMKKAKSANTHVTYICSNHPQKRTNSAVLICAYLVKLLLY